jgi:hypothetical protein
LNNFLMDLQNIDIANPDLMRKVDSIKALIQPLDISNLEPANRTTNVSRRLSTQSPDYFLMSNDATY